jgi:phosphate:Na+ symporter
MDLLKPANFSLLFALFGVLLVMGKDKKRKDIGNIIVGFAVLMCGMGLMGDSVSNLKGEPAFINLLTIFDNPVFGVIIGAVITGIIQSSAASVAILQTLVGPGSGFTFGMAIPIIMGQNIGTCVTALISSFGVNRNAKRVAIVHIAFNIIGTAIGLIVLYSLNLIFSFAFMAWEIDAFGIAICHLAFNLFTTAIILPFQNALVAFANKVIRDKQDEKKKVAFLDERLFATPAIAISECRDITVRMSTVVKEALLDALSVLNKYDKALADKVEEDEGLADKYEDKLGTYLVKLSSSDITVRDSQNVSTMLHSIGNFERISDHAVEISKTSEELNQKKLSFSEDAQKEIAVAENALREIIDLTFTAFETGDTALARKVEPLEQVIDKITAEMRSNHIIRLQAGTCTIELGFILNDLINCFERISDHCSNIAVAMIEVAEGEFETHKYLNAVKGGNDDTFRAEYETFAAKYNLAQ